MPTYCDLCESDPCHVEQFRDMLENLAGTFDEDSPPNISRRKMYQSYIRAVHGILGRGHRVVVPKCVAQFIRGVFPDPDGEYMGHRDS